MSEQIYEADLLPLESQYDSDSDKSQEDLSTSLSDILSMPELIISNTSSGSRFRQSSYKGNISDILELVYDHDFTHLLFPEKNRFRQTSDRDISSRRSIEKKKAKIDTNTYQSMKNNKRMSLGCGKPDVSTVFSSQILKTEYECLPQFDCWETHQRKREINSEQFMFPKYELFNLEHSIGKMLTPLRCSKIFKVLKQNYFTLGYSRSTNPHLLNWIDRQVMILCHNKSLYTISPDLKYPLRSLPISNQSCSITATTHHENNLLIGIDTGSYLLYDMTEERITKNQKIFQTAIGCVAWKDSNVIAVSNDNKEIALTDIRFDNNQYIMLIPCERSDEMKFSHNGDYLCSNSTNNQALLWDLRSLKYPLLSVNTPSTVKAIEWIPYSNIVAVASLNQLHIQQINEPSPTKIIDLKSTINGFKFSKKNNRLLSIHKGMKNNIQSWSIPELWKLQSFSDQSQNLINLLLSKDENEFLTMSSDRTLTIWALGEKEEQKRGSMLEEFQYDLR